MDAHFESVAMWNGEHAFLNILDHHHDVGSEMFFVCPQGDHNYMDGSIWT